MTTRIGAIRQRLASATPGPWEADEKRWIWIRGTHADICATIRTKGDAQFIAAAPEDIACLLDLLGRAKGALHEMNRKCEDGICEQCRQSRELLKEISDE
jgi:hypothetical protein